MAVLEHVEKGVRCRLFARHLVGRSRTADLRLREPNVSGEHAVVCWTGSLWEIRDLASRNGTFVNGRQLAPDERARLQVGTIVEFGRAVSHWRMIDAGPPEAVALIRGRRADERLFATDGFLALPSKSAPEVMVYRNAGGEWVAERDGAIEPVTDSSELIVGSQVFVLRLPENQLSTLDTERMLSIERMKLRIAVSRDEEYVQIEASWSHQSINLGARAHHYLLLTLARARLRDREAGVPPGAAGWVYHDELTRQLDMDPNHINIAVFRCRRQLGAAGVVGAANIVERRAPTRQLRLGVDEVEIVWA